MFLFWYFYVALRLVFQKLVELFKNVFFVLVSMLPYVLFSFAELMCVCCVIFYDIKRVIDCRCCSLTIKCIDFYQGMSLLKSQHRPEGGIVVDIGSDAHSNSSDSNTFYEDDFSSSDDGSNEGRLTCGRIHSLCA